MSQHLHPRSMAERADDGIPDEVRKLAAHHRAAPDQHLEKQVAEHDCI